MSSPRLALRLSPAVYWVPVAAVGFYLAYTFPRLGFCIFGFIVAIVQLARLPTARQAFYTGLLAGALCYPAQLTFFWGIFGQAALGLWMVLMLWLALFTALAQVAWKRIGGWPAAVSIACLWTGLEYFRSEVYFLRFSWLNVGYAFPHGGLLGMYGIGFAAALAAASLLARRGWLLAGAVALLCLPPVAGLIGRHVSPHGGERKIAVAGMQMEFPSEPQLLKGLDKLARDQPQAELLMLSEYTLQGPVPAGVKEWCRANRKYLVLGGADPAPGGQYYNTAFVVAPTGEIVFSQAKSMPIQFFHDGLPAQSQRVWDSPWGKLGICICYDLSYRRVTDRLVRLGAEALLVPTMDVQEWERQEHELHRRVAVARSEEYGIPIFRLASSGISQLTSPSGRELATAPFATYGAEIAGDLQPATGHVPLDAWLGPLCAGFSGLFGAWALLWLPWRHQTAPARSSDTLFE
jgi:apolipoprotein N-acyltransferase